MRLQIRAVRHFSIFIVYAYGLLLMVPVAIAMGATSVLGAGILPALLPLVVTLVTALILPVGFGNPYITRLVRSFLKNHGQGMDGFVVQLTLNPRARSGWRAVLEDADDVGFLQITPARLDYHGDSIDLEIPLTNIAQVSLQNIGLRGLFLYEQIRVELRGSQGLECVNFAERSSWFTPGSKRVTRAMKRKLQEHLGGQDQPAPVTVKSC